MQSCICMFHPTYYVCVHMSVNFIIHILPSYIPCVCTYAYTFYNMYSDILHVMCLHMCVNFTIYIFCQPTYCVCAHICVIV